ncbi:putative iron-sulfur flavoprotein [Desulforapulum autotrophicum HRM2]|uniref:Iron-sulfur flavoprotein n=1 Tax=Desulforapulum autotrophicum (strain ATCC 43914 / DSM 3382 / VKM B-1955 / HRM2) TaxID=177437 RepID=C0Q939_DESAH|nr:flavodoxin family protein [Desulforapulum autotrophicum]ACN16544.1 putative iron-sulfur flavoprotein [Desulforapulum autotrophicum HRM2]
MSIDVLGISGSPTKNSNTDRLVKAVLDATGAETEFVKLSSINVRPCLACYKCVHDNVCKQNDDFPALAEKIKTAKALVIGGYIPYSQIDGFTKALLERFWSFRHQKNLLKGKMVATVLTGLAPEALTAVNKALATEFKEYENMDLIGQVTVQGNIVCAFCGVGDQCEMSAFRSDLIETSAKAADFKYTKVEDQKDVWDEAVRIGSLMGERLK